MRSRGSCRGRRTAWSTGWTCRRKRCRRPSAPRSASGPRGTWARPTSNRRSAAVVRCGLAVSAPSSSSSSSASFSPPALAVSARCWRAPSRPFGGGATVTRTTLTLVRPANGDAVLGVGQAFNVAVNVDGRVPDSDKPDALQAPVPLPRRRTVRGTAPGAGQRQCLDDHPAAFADLQWILVQGHRRRQLNARVPRHRPQHPTRRALRRDLPPPGVHRLGRTGATATPTCKTCAGPRSSWSFTPIGPSRRAAWMSRRATASTWCRPS